MLAKRLGAHRVMALINRPAYAEMMQGGPIDVAISPQSVTIGSLLAHVRRGDVVRVHSLRRGGGRGHRGNRARLARWQGRRAARRRDQAAQGGHHRRHRPGQDVIMGHHDTVIEATTT